MEIQGNMLNIFGILLFYKVVGWFDGQDIGVESRRPRFNPLYKHILCGGCIFINIPCIYVSIHSTQVGCGQVGRRPWWVGSQVFILIYYLHFYIYKLSFFFINFFLLAIFLSNLTIHNDHFMVSQVGHVRIDLSNMIKCSN